MLAAVLAVGWLLIHALASSVEPLDNEAARWFADRRSGELSDAADAGSFLGDAPVGIAVAAMAAGLISLWQLTARPAVFFALLVAGVGGVYGLATVVVSRQRPPVHILGPGLVPNHRYPSGHVATAIAVYGATALLVSRLAPHTRAWVWVLGLVPALWGCRASTRARTTSPTCSPASATRPPGSQSSPRCSTAAPARRWGRLSACRGDVPGVVAVVMVARRGDI